MAAALWIFWAALSFLAFTFLGYPLLIALLTLGRTRPASASNSNSRPRVLVSVVLVVHNEAHQLAARLDNLMAAEYPAEWMQWILVADGCTDDTAQIARAYLPQGWLYLELPEQQGKAQGLNAGLAAATGELVVLADARQRFAVNTVRELVAGFDDPQVGAVSGELVIAPTDQGLGRGIDAYWRWERFLRRGEAVLDSCIGCSGAVYALRRTLFVPLPADTILDDVVIPLQIAQQGFRVIFRPAAVAFDPQPLTPEAEASRKRRTLAGNFQMLFRYPAWCWPWHHRLALQLIAHKYLRLASPFFLLTALFANLFLVRERGYAVLLALQWAFYGLGLAGAGLPKSRRPWFTLPSAFLFLNLSILRGFWDYCTKATQANRTARAGKKSD